MIDKTSMAGILNLEANYKILENKELADQARENGDVTIEEAMGKQATLVCYYEDNLMVLHRVMELFEGFYKHELKDENTLILHLEIHRDGKVYPSQETFLKQ
eukprot:TRINITY_DN38_c0_g1_i1.p1 TRINITY_DN38_c0_g1~~TRINITY_DN38_c0_g1_i1.p1  ORF type:complete len:102 (-),score=33.54 TRINITY_DN38_c0_g1_i1:108-413(-)